MLKRETPFLTLEKRAEEDLQVLGRERMEEREGRWIVGAPDGKKLDFSATPPSLFPPTC